jgi:hypothetical protein
MSEVSRGRGAKRRCRRTAMKEPIAFEFLSPVYCRTIGFSEDESYQSVKDRWLTR